MLYLPIPTELWIETGNTTSKTPKNKKGGKTQAC
jgi:hypothetical protein